MASDTVMALPLTVTASAALTQQRFVGADNAPCQAGAVALGVAEVDAAAGDVTPVNVLGIVAVEAGAAIAKGQNVQSDENACAVPQTAASGDTPAGISAGIALDEALAEGDVIRILRGV